MLLKIYDDHREYKNWKFNQILLKAPETKWLSKVYGFDHQQSTTEQKVSMYFLSCIELHQFAAYANVQLSLDQHDPWYMYFH